jgi:ankyrin repeat protein
MKHLLLTTIAAVVLVGCGPSMSLHEAAIKGDVEVVKQHISRGEDLSSSKFGRTPLHVAAMYGHKEIVKLLISAGADVNVKDKRGGTPLEYAEVSEDDTAEEKSNLQQTAKFIRELGGKTSEELKAAESIWHAIEIGNINAVEKHLDAGIDVNATGSKWREVPLLHAATKSGHKGVVGLLISKGADVNATNVWGDTSLHVAASSGHKEIANLLISKGVDVNSTDKAGNTPLHDVTSVEIADLLITAGADVNIKEHRGWTPLHYSAYRGYLKISDLLISKGLDVDSKEGSGSSPLAFAAQGHADVVKLLISKGANVNIKDIYGSTPLHSAAFSHDLEAVISLIDKRINVNSISIFYLAGDSGYYGEETTPLDCVYAKPELISFSQTSSPKEEIIKLLRKHGCKTKEELTNHSPDTSSLLMAVEKRDLQLATKLIEDGADVEERGSRKFGKRSATPLYYAAYNVDPAMTRLLLESGANVNAVDYQGEIPLHTAIYHSFPNVEEDGIKVIKMLIENGSDVNWIKSFPRKLTPLDFAKVPNGKIADLLRKHGGKTGEELKAEGK